MKEAALSSARKTGAANVLANSSAIVFLFAMLMISASAAGSGADAGAAVSGAGVASAYSLQPFVGPAAHTADVVLSPDWTLCQANNDFTVTITNNGPAALKIIEIYNKSYPGNVEFTPPPHTNFACGAAPSGWQLNEVLIGGIKLCQYFGDESTFLNASKSEVFTFSAKTTGESNYSWGVITRDVNQTWIAHYPKITVDCTPPNTTKTYGTPSVLNNGTYDWINSSTPITLTAIDPDPHPIGVESIHWSVTPLPNVPDSACVEKCTFEGSGSWNTVNDDEAKFTIPDSSCHLIEYYSEDKIGNTENPIKRQCVFVDNTPPVESKVVGDKNIPEPAQGIDYLVSNSTPITLDCKDENQPHPVYHEKVYWQISTNASGQWITEDWQNSTQLPVTIYFKEDSYHDLEFYCTDGLGNQGLHDLEHFIVDAKPPVIVKTLTGPRDGDCLPSDADDKCYILPGETTITVDAFDPEPHPSGDVTCDWNYLYNGKWIEGGDDVQVPFNITFEEDSKHILQLECEDAVGNEVYDNETFLVDGNPPVTEKTYGQPRVEWWYPKGCSLTPCGWADWISSKTPVYLTANDTKVGVNKTYWRNMLVNNSEAGERICGGEKFKESYCKPQYYNKYVNLSTQWNEYTGQPFYKEQESCHVIEYFSVDKLGNEENKKWQCVFVDNTAPEVNKTIGEPKTVSCKDSDITNPGFEAGNLGGWSVDAQNDSVSVVAADGYTSPYEGKYMAMLGDDNGGVSGSQTIGENAISQVFTVTRPTLSFAYNIFTFDYTGFNHFGYEVIRVSDGSVIYQYDQGAWGSGTSLKTTGWQAVNLDLSGYIGEQVKLIVSSGGTSDQEYSTWTYIDGVGCDQYITKNTPITLTCKDVLPHPVDHVNISYRFRVGDDCKNWGNWTGWTTVSNNGPDYTLSTTLRFENDSCHELEYNCTDGLGNGGIVKSEIDVVDTKAPEINKTIVGPKIETECNPIEAESCVGFDGCFAGGDIKKDFFTTGRYGNNGEAGAWELAIWNVSGGSETVKVQENYIWSKNQLVPFSLTYYANNGSVIYIVGAKTLQGTYEANKAFDYIIPFVKGKSGVSSELSDIVLNGVPIGNLNSGSGYRGKRISISDADQADGFTLTGKVKFNWGNPQNEIPGFHVFAMNTHDRENKSTCTFIDGVTNISVEAKDPEPHPVNDVTCSWDYEVIGGDKEGAGQTGVGSQFLVHFPEESKHRLTIVCKDKLNNTVKDAQTYYVDHTPPETTKRLEGPQYPEDAEDAKYPRWINNKTNITFSVYDAGPHKSGINATYTKVSLVDDKYCRDQKLCQTLDGSNGLLKVFDQSSPKLYTTIPGESCHLIEYYSVDNVNKTEETKKQCVFVDNTGPNATKIVGKPNSEWDGKDAKFYNISDKCNKEGGIDCWKVTTLTPIAMRCTDVNPHPVGNENISFNVDVDGKDLTAKYCGYYGGTIGTDGFCAVSEPSEGNKTTALTIKFLETSEHNLAFYCTDKLGNRGNTDDEKFKVEDVPFNITLNHKWNLISVPFVLLNDSMHKVFDPMGGTVMSVWTYDAFTKQWFVFTPDGNDANDNLDRMLPGWGYWVLTNNDTELLIGGSLFSPGGLNTPPTKNIAKGWNLIGYWGTEGFEGYTGPESPDSPKGKGKTAGCELFSLKDTLWTIEASSIWGYWQPWYDRVAEINKPWYEWVPYSLGDRMDPGAGYWIHTNQEGEYVIPTVCGGLFDSIE